MAPVRFTLFIYRCRLRECPLFPVNASGVLVLMCVLTRIFLKLTQSFPLSLSLLRPTMKPKQRKETIYFLRST